tara:strand:+ start:1994 stop:2173 length:180 start_codon:yes stop_codon:yes gene_type:complete
MDKPIIKTLSDKEKEVLEISLRFVSDDVNMLDTFSDLLGEELTAVEVEDLIDKLTQEQN